MSFLTGSCAGDRALCLPKFAFGRADWDVCFLCTCAVCVFVCGCVCVCVCAWLLHGCVRRRTLCIHCYTRASVWARVHALALHPPHVRSWLALTSNQCVRENKDFETTTRVFTHLRYQVRVVRVGVVSVAVVRVAVVRVAVVRAGVVRVAVVVGMVRGAVVRVGVVRVGVLRLFVGDSSWGIVRGG